MHALDPLANFVIPAELLRLVAEVDEFKGRWHAAGNLAPERLSRLKKIATVESVASSTRIEGVVLTDREVERLLSGLSTTSFRTRDEQEVAGYAEVMETVFAMWAEMPITENVVRQLHGMLLRHSSKDERHRGHYKTVPNHAEAFDGHGHGLGGVFQTATPFDTPFKMTELFDWFARATSAAEQHPLLLVAVFVVRLLAIHPFQDGNGRLSRVLTTLLLLKAGYAYVPYASLERVVEENKDNYYLSLRRAQATLDKGEAQLGEWILFFLRSLTTQKRTLERKLASERVMAPLPALSEHILRSAREHGRVTVLGIVELTGATRATVRNHLRELVANNVLELHGRGRGAWYQAK